ncbi:MAG: glycosyltransferase, partial [Candidatus Dormibacteraeota bacterium]|nr:glycosyltransferase [Candidatus Dormibacteraeota bacterium]
AVKDLRLELQDVRRELARSRMVAGSDKPVPAVRRAWEGPAYRALGAPRVSIVTALYNHRRWVVEALQSVATSTYRDLEMIVVDDGSSDGSAERVQAWGEANAEVPLLILQHPLNRGLPSARNTGLDFARGEFVLILDSDNKILPSCLGKLVEALDADPGADFAYGMLASFDDDGYQGLVSYFPWDPWRLRKGNYIDALALLRTRALRDLGGYTLDRRLYGWEDYDLYCRIAEQGGRGAFVPEVVASYRQSPASMRSLTDISTLSAFGALAERCPTLMKGAVPFDDWR